MSRSVTRILCVDDEPPNLSLLEAMLSPRGYSVISAVNGPEALEKIAAERIDICLLDVMLPGMDGFEVCRRIKSDDLYRNIPVVMVTSYQDKANRIRGIEAGAEDFISKPFDSAEVLARIKMLLHVKSLNEELQNAHDILESAVHERTKDLTSDKISNLHKEIVERQEGGRDTPGCVCGNQTVKRATASREHLSAAGGCRGVQLRRDHRAKQCHVVCFLSGRAGGASGCDSSAPR